MPSRWSFFVGESVDCVHYLGTPFSLQILRVLFLADKCRSSCLLIVATDGSSPVCGRYHPSVNDFGHPHRKSVVGLLSVEPPTEAKIKSFPLVEAGSLMNWIEKWSPPPNDPNPPPCFRFRPFPPSLSHSLSSFGFPFYSDDGTSSNDDSFLHPLLGVGWTGDILWAWVIVEHDGGNGRLQVGKWSSKKPFPPSMISSHDQDN